MNKTKKRFWFCAATVIFLCPLVYVGSFYLLMDTKNPAIDGNMEIAFKSSFIIGTGRMTNHRGVTTHFRCISFFNRFYLPMDKLHHHLFPDSYNPEVEKMFTVRAEH